MTTVHYKRWLDYTLRSTLAGDSPRYFSNHHLRLVILRGRNPPVDERYPTPLPLRAFVTKQTLVTGNLAFSAYCHLITSLCFRSVTLIFSNYVVAYEFLRFFKVFNFCKVSAHYKQTATRL